VELGRLAEVIELLEEEGHGVTVMPVAAGMRAGGFGSEDAYLIDGWAVGVINPNGGDDLAVASTIAEAVERAIGVVRSNRAVGRRG
jgi:hypothetical protein